ncbi:MAG: site-2 protease family protein [Bifidobacteriaceae bacterium]|jgi:membrane-associated protease RseP (regulator of RpoE activity)|nr:site-2 protease family protein [Bifidobacteriaceae bacterium]
MTYVLGAVVLIVILIVSVAWHELGHLLPAKAFKVPVTQYMVGFGPTIWSKKVGETEYGLKWVLLGGYIHMLGMYSPRRSARAAKTGWRASLADAAREVTREELAELGAGPGGLDARAYYRRSAPRKLVIMLGGPTMNLILALFLLVLALSAVGVYEPSTTISAVTACVTAEGQGAEECGQGTVETPARAAGLEAGDKIVAWDGHAVSGWDQFLGLVASAPARPTAVTVLRGGAELDLEITPLRVGEGESARSLIGVTAGATELVKKPVSAAPGVLWNQVAASAKLYAQLPVSVWNTLVDLVQGNERAADSPASVVGIASVAGQVAAVEVDDPAVDENRLRWGTWLQLGAMVNIALWLFNLLPLLPLDGGHVVNALYEGARRAWARARGRPDPGPADSARLMPLTYVVVGLLILMTVILVMADVLNPYQL